jgi:maltose alpha-D-glucosyltransferase/alpha-amylase
LRAYDAVAREAGLFDGVDSNRSLLELFELEKALYELRYEIANRPDWVSIPLSDLVEPG